MKPDISYYSFLYDMVRSLLRTFKFNIVAQLKSFFVDFSQGYFSQKILVSSFSSFTSVQKFTYPAIMKIDSPEFKNLFVPELKTLLEIFRKYKYEIRIAGGAVRDILSGSSPKDVDFATTATPDQMKEMFELENIRMINTKGEKHGTITARINNENFEVTTLRIDLTTDGRHAVVEFTKDWKLDASRRDLTFNSLFLGEDGTVYDYFGGYEDLRRKNVIFVGDAGKRIQEDYLRILRYFRFYGRIADHPDKHNVDMLKAIQKNVSGLGKISGERIWSELSKILLGNFASHLVKKIIEVGAGPFVGFPESPNIEEMCVVCDRCKDLNPHPITLVTALMPKKEDFLKFHERCKLSAFERDLGQFVISHRSDNIEEKPLLYYKSLMTRTDKINDTRRYILELLKYNAEKDDLKEIEDWVPPKLPLNGNLLKEHGVPPGKILGRVLTRCRELWSESHFKLTQEELLSQLPQIMDEMGIKQKV